MMNLIILIAWQIAGVSGHIAGLPSTRSPDSLPAGALGDALPGFHPTAEFAEQICTYRVDPGVAVLINAPGPGRFNLDLPVRIIFYTLPNGNTTAQTIGRKMAPGVDWHYDIQHIGAQTRVLRHGIPDENIVVVYLEADGRSWPSWKQKHADHGQIIRRVFESVRGRFEGRRCVFELSGHSGGGSFVFGLIDSSPRIPGDIRRISFLDSNYGYSDAAGHGDKLVEWLKGKPDRVLSVICYDDRNVTLDGKPIVSPTGGTYRRSLEMVERLGKDFTLARSADGDLLRYRGLDGRIEIILHGNPQNKILHTALVGQMNGFIHAMTVGTPHEGKLAPFGGPPAYTQLIQAE